MEEGLNGPPTVPDELRPPAGDTPRFPTLLTVRLTLRLVLPLPVVVLVNPTVSL